MDLNWGMWKWLSVSRFGRVRLFAMPWTVVTRLLCPWDSPGKNTGVGCHALLQGIFPTQGSSLYLLHWEWILYSLSGKYIQSTTAYKWTQGYIPIIRTLTVIWPALPRARDYSWFPWSLPVSFRSSLVLCPLQAEGVWIHGSPGKEREGKTNGSHKEKH